MQFSPFFLFFWHHSDDHFYLHDFILRFPIYFSLAISFCPIVNFYDSLIGLNVPWSLSWLIFYDYQINTNFPDSILLYNLSQVDDHVDIGTFSLYFYDKNSTKLVISEDMSCFYWCYCLLINYSNFWWLRRPGSMMSILTISSLTFLSLSMSNRHSSSTLPLPKNLPDWVKFVKLKNLDLTLLASSQIIWNWSRGIGLSGACSVKQQIWVNSCSRF